MSKIEEITELLVAEISEFEQAVKRLETIQKAKIGIDITELKEELAQRQLEIQRQQEQMRSWAERFERKMGTAKIYPTWAVVVFCLSLLFNCIVTVILLYKH